MTNIENLLNWSEPQNLVTTHGPRILRTAPADNNFWALWRSNKSELQSQGVSCRKGSDGWEVCWWIDPSVEQTFQAAVATAPAPETVAATSVNWSDEQEAIFNWFKKGTGHLVVEARAGTGKTTTIKEAFSVAPEDKILYAVFNKKNQIEAKEKIHDSRVDVRTLHSLGYFFIKQVWSSVKPDDEVEYDRVREVLNGVELPDDVLAAVIKLIGFAKNTLLVVTQGALETLAVERDVVSEETESNYSVTAIAKLALQSIELAKQKDELGRVSFNDMVWLPVVMGWVTPRYNLVCIDEAQDMNMLQLSMARGACKSDGRICVVGDSRQAIYGFRGAVSDGMEMMKVTLSAITLGLTTTYRCPKSVVALASEIVPDYQAAPTAPEGIVDEVDLGRVLENVKVGDSILSRLNAPLVSICLKLLRNGAPARIEGRDIGRQLIGMVRKLKAKSVPDFLKKLNAWGNKQINRVSAGSIGAAKESRITMIQDQVETLTAIAEGADSVSDIEKRLNNLFQDSEGVTKNVVLLSSCHKAKGLEWDRVFMLSATFRKDHGNEEANIYYVALTRAKKHLTFVQ